MVFSVVKKFFSVLVALITLVCSGSAMPERRTDPVFTGTFLQPWLAAYWSKDEWKSEIEEMKRDGIEYLIIQNVADKTQKKVGGEWTVYYDGEIDGLSDAQKEPDIVKAALDACKGSGIKVMIGLAVFGDFWYQGAFTKQYDECCRISAELVKDIYKRYGEEYKDTLFGFYFTPEFSNIVWDSASALLLSKGLNVILDEMSASCGDLPLAMSPYVTNYLTLGKVDMIAFWSKIFSYSRFRDGDIIAPQDAVGAKFTKTSELERNWKMFRTLVDNSEAKLKLWANCESFSIARAKTIISGIAEPDATENKVSVPAGMDRFALQLDVASRYCDNIITFSYNHYLSENQVAPQFVEAYRTYIKNGYVPETNAPSDPSDFKKAQTEGGISLTWNEAKDDVGIAYYRITKNGKFLSRIECIYNDTELSFVDESGKLSDEYVITACDTSGNLSAPVTAK